MIKFPSEFLPEELAERWDDYTSPARFAGNDDTMDLIFVSKRNGDKVRLVRKARTVREPFTCVFRGRIKKTEKGSEIEGVFTKSIFDYLIVGLIIAFMFYARSLVLERGGSPVSINGLLAIAIIGGIGLLINYRSAKRAYSEFIFRITGMDMPMFLSKKEAKKHTDK